MNQKNIWIAIVIGIVFFFALLGGNESSSTPTGSNSSSYYYSGKGNDWDEQVNDIYNEYGEDAGMSAAEIDAAMRAMEQGLQ